MEFNQTVMARRSLRAYEEGKTVEKAQIEELISFAQMAPSWKNYIRTSMYDARIILRKAYF